ncbi:hypothetical protein QEV83_08790 [Methylocapsa sp. D3K7]|uniref:hypothetical protein n=1 Tax=Methylocapsa sp. D3K7 TaxID=3041435 RepID=UPI00244EDA5D|nr:hypothetical protein [Methylocapsa sp. D3K7]WGJ16317.1 hypothetical protein QEV83_08790 [Methylocapsa sp. D3K7]
MKVRSIKHSDNTFLDNDHKKRSGSFSNCLAAVIHAWRSGGSHRSVAQSVHLSREAPHGLGTFVGAERPAIPRKVSIVQSYDEKYWPPKIPLIKKYA